jgi:hypothetical protein
VKICGKSAKPENGQLGEKMPRRDSARRTAARRRTEGVARIVAAKAESWRLKADCNISWRENVYNIVVKSAAGGWPVGLGYLLAKIGWLMQRLAAIMAGGGSSSATIMKRNRSGNVENGYGNRNAAALL